MSFDVAKSSLLSKLATGVDFSPKGSIDAPVVQLVDFINNLPDFVTTSSCSGRISVYRDENSTKGIQWLLVVHGAITVNELKAAISGQEAITAGQHFIVLKCEGFILHVRCRDLASGRKLHQIAMGCGFRESGLSVGQKMRVQLAIRTTAYGLELPIAVGKRLILDDDALDIIVKEANRRLRCNFARTDRLLGTLKKEYLWPSLICRDLADSGIRRWGHCCASDSNDVFIISGGYGVECYDGILNNDSQKSTRKLSSLLHNKPSGTVSAFSLGKSNSNEVDSSMHAASALFQIDGCSYLIITGGRESPKQALPCLRVFKQFCTSTEGTALQSPYTAIDFVESGDLPKARWGHTLTKLGENSERFVLHGGRDEQQVFGDSYLLTVSPCLDVDPRNIADCGIINKISDGPVLSFQWCRISSPDNLLDDTDTQFPLSNPAPRFFHAACFIAVTDEIFEDVPSESIVDRGHDHYISDVNSARVLIHGGLLSLSDPVTCGLGYILCVHTGLWSPFFNTSSWAVSKNTDLDKPIEYSIDATENDEDIRASKAITENDDCVRECTAITTPSSVAFAHTTGSNSTSFLRRFGHTITDIGGKTLVLAGGVSFEGRNMQNGTEESRSSNKSDNANDDIDEYAGVCAIDLQMTEKAQLWGSLRIIPLIHPNQQGTERTNFISARTEGEGEARGVLGSDDGECKKAEESILSCRDCRTHHTAIYERERKFLTLHGGGAICMSFGAHYCTSVRFDIVAGKSAMTLLSDSVSANESISDTDTSNTRNRAIATMISDYSSNGIEKEVTMALLVPSSRVKTVKTLLEDPKMNFLDKKRRITVSEVSAKDIIIVPVQDIILCCDDFENYEVEMKNQKLLEKEKNSMKKNALNLIVGPDASTIKSSGMKKGSPMSKDTIPQGGVKSPEGSSISKDTIPESGAKSPEGLMAIPITASLVNILLGKSSSGLSKTSMKELCLCLGEEYLCSDNSNNDNGSSDSVYTADDRGDNEKIKKEEKAIEVSSIVDSTQVKISDPTIKTSCIETNRSSLSDNLANANLNIQKKNIPLNLNFKLGQQHVRVSKTLLADGFRKANQYLESVVREYRLPVEAMKLLPKKYETVGNILMIPEDSLEGPIWENLLPPPVPSSSSRTAWPIGEIKFSHFLFISFRVKKTVR